MIRRCALLADDHPGVTWSHSRAL